jgi:hypothetical protein
MRTKIQLNGYSVDIVENPEQVLGSGEISKIVDQCGNVARESFGNDKITDEDIYIHSIKATVATYIKDMKDRILGFGSSARESLDGDLVVHLKGSAVLPHFQGKGLYKMIMVSRLLLESKRLGTENFLYGSRTQNPIVVQTMTGTFRMYPLLGQRTDERIMSIAEKYAQLVQEKHSEFYTSKWVGV